MTLILTERSSMGIVMAADSAVTTTNTRTGHIVARPNQAQKLHRIPYLNAGISCWGVGSISGTPTDQWLSNFIDAHQNINNLGAFARELARQLNTELTPRAGGSLGLHLAGYEMFNNNPTPSFYHIHDGRSEELQGRGITVDPNVFNANHDWPPELFDSNLIYITRNGDYQLYAQIFGMLGQLFQSLLNEGISVPHSQNLDDRAEYLVFQIRTISEIYRLSNLIPGIGGGICYLTINPQGIRSFGIKYF